MAGELSVGSLVAFIAVLGGLLRPAGSLVNLWNDIQQVRLASERLGTFFASKPESKLEGSEDRCDTDKISSAVEINKDTVTEVLSNLKPPEISFRNVSYRYHGTGKFDPPALDDISITIEAGRVYGIIGSSGSGKSTMAQLMARFDDPTEGSIFYDGQDLRSIDPSVLRRNVGYMSQDVYLFNTSIRENISYGNMNITEKEILESADLVGATQFINNLPRKFDTVLSERGMGLSGGQRQRIALARMICRRPRLLILDEVTSSLDLQSEETIYKNLHSYFKRRTVVIISHRRETLKYVDQTLELEKGVLLTN